MIVHGGAIHGGGGGVSGGGSGGGGVISPTIAAHFSVPITTVTKVFEIPLVSVPQKFQIAIGGTNYQLGVWWCWPMECWMMDLILADTNTQLLMGFPLVTGADLLQQYAYLGLPGQLIVQTDADVLAAPTFDNLGQLAHLYYVPFNQTS
jgi:hypothetical protein